MATFEVLNLITVKRDPAFAEQLISDGKLFRRCIQCGTCTASCPAAHAMNLSPRQM